MSFESFIAFRYLRSKKSYRFLSFLSLISLLGIFISVFSFVVIHSVMNGFSSHLREALIGFDAHLIVQKANGESMAWLKKQKEVVSVVPIIEFAAILETPSGIAGGGKIRGMNLEDLQKETSLKEASLKEASLEIYFFDEKNLSALKGSEESPPGLLLGEELYARLRFIPGDEEMVSLIYPFGDVGPTGEIEPRRRDFQVLGVISTGFYDYDMQYVFVDKSEGQRLAGIEDSQILVRLTDIRKTALLRDRFLREFPNEVVSTWEEQNRRLFSALKIERAGMVLLLSIVTFIACFNVFGLMTLLTLTKTREMALFYTMGLTRRKMGAVFRRMGVLLGLIGTGLGLISGLGAVYLLRVYPLPLPPAYYLEALPAQVDWRMILIVLVMSPFFSILAAWGPGYQASRLNPMEILRTT